MTTEAPPASAPAPIESSGETSQSPAQSPAQPQGKPTLPEVVKFKVNGVDVEMPLAEAIRRAALAEGAHGRLKEANEIKKKAEEESGLWEKDPIKALMQRKGMTKKEAVQYYEDLVVNHLAEPELTPEQEELQQYKQAERARKEAEEAAKQEELSKSQQLELQRELVNLDKELNSAFASTSLPPDDFLKAWATDLLRGAAETGVELDTETAVKEVEYRYLTNIRKQLGSLDTKALKSLLGPEVFKKVREADVAALKEAEAPFRKPSGPVKQESSAEKPKQRESLQDRMNKIRGINYTKNS
jgi:hypothetical protein